MVSRALDLGTGRTGGREATTGVIPGRISLSVGLPALTPPKGWAWTPLSSVAQLESGHTPSRKHPEYWDGDIPWIGIKDATENHGKTIHDTYQHVTELGLANSSARLLPANTVCLSRTASVGFVVVMGRPMATSQDFVNWVCGPNIEAHFLKYVLVAENEALWRFASGTTHQTIYYPEAKAFHICLPPPAEQKAIISVSCALDDKIELNRQMNETLEALAKSLFNSWFVDATQAGPPKGWEERSLDEIASFLNGLALQKFPPEGNDSLPVIKIVQLRAGHTEGADRAGTNLPPQYIIEDGDVLFSWSGSLEVEIWCGGHGALNQHLFKVTSAHFPKWFYYLWTRYHLADFQNTAANKATTMGHIQRHHLSEAKVFVPPPALMETMNKQFAPLLDKLIANRLESRTLAALRDALLPKLLSGELRVPGG